MHLYINSHVIGIYQVHKNNLLLLFDFDLIITIFYRYRYSGNYDTLGVVIDEVANTLWNNVSNVYLSMYKSKYLNSFHSILATDIRKISITIQLINFIY